MTVRTARQRSLVSGDSDETTRGHPGLLPVPDLRAERRLGMEGRKIARHVEGETPRGDGGATGINTALALRQNSLAHIDGDFKRPQ